jgi:hypothetical protein
MDAQMSGTQVGRSRKWANAEFHMATTSVVVFVFQRTGQRPSRFNRSSRCWAFRCEQSMSGLARSVAKILTVYFELDFRAIWVSSKRLNGTTG